MVLGIHGQLVVSTDEVPSIFSRTLGKSSCTIFNSIKTAFDKIISSCVHAHTAVVVVVELSGESSTVIYTVASPSTGMLVLLAAPSFRLDGNSCLLLQPMFF